MKNYKNRYNINLNLFNYLDVDILFAFKINSKDVKKHKKTFSYLRMFIKYPFGGAY